MKKIYLTIFLIVVISSIVLISAAEFGYNTIENKNAFFGTVEFDGKCIDGGVEISDGTICAQRLEVFNVTTVNIIEQNVTVLEDFNVEGNITAEGFIGKIFGTFYNWTIGTLDKYILASFDGSSLDISLDETELNNTIILIDTATNESVNDWVNDEFVPYVGAIKNVNLGSNNLTVGAKISSSVNESYIEYKTNGDIEIWI